jgi:catechol 2,3-dioxygenase-like lactoylglutathione lyase family enzyme
MPQGEFPTQDVVLTHLLVVSDLDRSKRFYQEVLGATPYREYGGTSCVLRFQDSWLLLVTGGGPTVDKPSVTFAPPADPETVSHETLKARGAVFLSPPKDWGAEIRCFFRDPDGHLLEISQAV